jgi:LSD1 subclass zinc finger protein
MGSIRNWLYRFFSGRRGVDQLTMALLVLSIVLSLLSSMLRLGILSTLSMASWIYGLFRMLSKNIPAREKENAWFLSKYTPVASNVKQARVRFKNRKIYLYYRCPNCRAWLKLPRNIGEKTVTCGKCQATFKKKA